MGFKIKKTVNGETVWEPIKAKKYTASKITEYTGALPITITTDGNSLLDYRIYGNTEQTGTPTPENPIIPIGCGERTENLVFTGWAEDFVRRAAMADVYITQVDGRTCLYAWANIGYGEYDTKYMFKTNFKESTVYTLSLEYMRPSNLSRASTIQVQYTDGTAVQLPSYINDGNWHKYNYVTASGKTVKSICCYYSSGYVYIDVNTFMLTEGSTPPTSYIPYGYKLPILSNSTVTNIYLGEVETTRRIKKLVLTGREKYDYQPQYSRYVFTVSSALAGGLRITPCFCTHYQSIYDGEPIDNIPNNTIYINWQATGAQFCIKDEAITTLADFNAYLAAQYAAGTPVTIWYVLAEPETGIVNEPLMKIDNYADTISMEQAGVSIPTSKGTNIIDYDGATKPSQMYTEYNSWSGWSDIDNYKMVNGNWTQEVTE